MKQIFTSLALLMCTLCASAQTISVTYNGQPVANGDVIRCGITETLAMGPMNRFVFEPALQMSVDQEAEVNVITDFDTEGGQICLGGTCTTITPGNPLTKTVLFEENEPQDMQLEWIQIKPSSDGLKAKATVSARLSHAMMDQIAFTIEFDSAIEAGIATIENDRAASTALYDLQGRQVNSPRHGIYLVKTSKGFVKTMK